MKVYASNLETAHRKPSYAGPQIQTAGVNRNWTTTRHPTSQQVPASELELVLDNLTLTHLKEPELRFGSFGRALFLQWRMLWRKKTKSLFCRSVPSDLVSPQAYPTI